MISAEPRKPVLGLLLIIAVVIAALSAIDVFLARTETAEVHGAAERSYAAGKLSLREGKAMAAVDLLRNAHSLERRNSEYELGLIGALMAVGKAGEADPLMEEILEREPNNGEANLAAARLRVKEGMREDAEAYYHRAIYGEWADNPKAHRRAARLELIQLLSGKEDRQKLLAELISLEGETDGDAGAEKQLAHSFLVAGSPARAAGVYRALVDRDSEDAEAYAGLGEAELEQGRYREAHAAFQAAGRQPNAAIGKRLLLLNSLIALDPTPRRLPSIEKYNRSLRILDLARADLGRRAELHPASVDGAAKGEIDSLIASAVDILGKKTPPHVTNELAEEALTLAEKIWKTRTKTFGDGGSASDEALRLIMEKLAS